VPTIEKWVSARLARSALPALLALACLLAPLGCGDSREPAEPDP
jgi:hypothetical protein